MTYNFLWLFLSMDLIFTSTLAIVKLPKNATVPAVFMFGDSIVDTGNNNDLTTIVKSNFPPYGRDFPGGVPTGRFSNGKIPSDFVVEELGIKEYLPAYLDPDLQEKDLLTGVNFASSGSEFVPLPSAIVKAMPLSEQLEMLKECIEKLNKYVGKEKANNIISNSFFMVETGSDDLVNTYYHTPTRFLQYDIYAYTDLMLNEASDFVQKLYEVGARRIGMISVPPVGCLPAQITLAGGIKRRCVKKYNEAAELFNTKLSAMADSQNKRLSEARVVFMDAYNPFLHILQHIHKYGFEVVNKGCCGTGIIEVGFLCHRWDPNTCKNVSRYVFWDSYHPTEKAYQILVHQTKFKGLTKSTQDFFETLIHGRPKPPPCRNPIDILKRLQREAFSDLMKLRDRQDKVEKIVSLYGTSRGKGSPFQEANTILRGEFDHLGAVLFIHDDEFHQDSEALSRAGIRTGINSRFSVETTVRQNDMLVAEFVASEKHKNDLSDLSECSLSLAKVSYTANVCDWLSAIAIPVGAQCRDVALLTNPSHQGKGLTDLSSFGPPLLNEHNGSAIGLMVKKANVVASLAQFVSGQVGSSRVGRCFSSFGQVVCQLPARTKLSLLGLHQVPKLSSEHVHYVAPTIGLGDLVHHPSPETTVEAYTPPLGTISQENVSTGSIALMLESELDEITKIGGWIEMKQSNPKHLEWAVTISDDSEDSFGWGVSLNGGLGAQGPQSWNHFQVESYMKFNLGKRLGVKPGITTHILDGKPRRTAFMLQSNWFL